MVFIEEARLYDTAASAETPAEDNYIKVWWIRIWCQVTHEY